MNDNFLVLGRQDSAGDRHILNGESLVKGDILLADLFGIVVNTRFFEMLRRELTCWG